MKAKKIYELLDFERGKDPKAAMGLGQIYIKQRIIDLFPKLSPGDKDYNLHKSLIEVILKPEILVSINEKDNIITVKNNDPEKLPSHAFESLFEVIIDHINYYHKITNRNDIKLKIARINDPMSGAIGSIELIIFEDYILK